MKRLVACMAGIHDGEAMKSQSDLAIKLDDVVGVETLKTIPLAYLGAGLVEPYYQDGYALLSLTISSMTFTDSSLLEPVTHETHPDR